MKSTLAATLIASAVGIGIWVLGITKEIWPAHPEIADLLITIAVSILVKRTWPSDPKKI